jgi:hypothetical protein
MSSEGQRAFPAQDGTSNAADVGAGLEHGWWELPGRLLRSWEGAPLPRRQVIPAFLAHGAAPWGAAAGLRPRAASRRRAGGPLAGGRAAQAVRLPPLRAARREAVNPVRRPPPLIQGCLRGAKL